MTQEMRELAMQNLQERLQILQETYNMMFNPLKDTDEQRQLEMWEDNQHTCRNNA